ncbi:MAG: hypothetical protein ACXAB4_11780, partial [Candidatus Hodarchaeales archaeon]
MQLTYEGAAYFTPDQQKGLQNLMRHYQATKRFAFKRLLENHSRQVIVDSIRQRSLLSNARYIRSAIAETQALIRSQHELVPLYYREAQWRAQQAHQRLTAYQQQLIQQPHSSSQKQEQKLKGLKRRAQKTASKRTYWEMHRQNKTFPTVVFGGKRQLQAY